MLVGHVGRIEPDFIGGWAADTDRPDAVVDVVIYVDGKRVAQVPCDQFREDLRDLKIYGGGRHGFRYVFPTPLLISAVDRVTVRFAATGAILPDGERIFEDATPLRPILVTAPGRSGTTLLMSRLSRSPQICVAEMHPFEVRQISYWSTVVATLTRDADFERSMHPDRLEGDGFKVGSNPFSHPDYADVFRTRELEWEYFRAFVPTQLQDAARRAIEEYYLRIREDRRKAEALFFAEKGNNLNRQTRNFARDLFPGMKEIVLVRDPRDLLCSQVSYFRGDPDKVRHEISEASRELLGIRRAERDSVLFTKYEDLVLDRRRALAGLAEYLGTDPFPSTDDEEEQAGFRVHGTSMSPESSIGRWKSDLPDSLVPLCRSEWAEFLEQFGYTAN